MLTQHIQEIRESACSENGNPIRLLGFKMSCDIKVAFSLGARDQEVDSAQPKTFTLCTRPSFAGEHVVKCGSGHETINEPFCIKNAWSIKHGGMNGGFDVVAHSMRAISIHSC